MRAGCVRVRCAVDRQDEPAEGSSAAPGARGCCSAARAVCLGSDLVVYEVSLPVMRGVSVVFRCRVWRVVEGGAAVRLGFLGPLLVVDEAGGSSRWRRRGSGCCWRPWLCGRTRSCPVRR